MTTGIVIDTDTGVDDFFAIVQALRSPELHVEALTTVGGNVPLRYATRNALRAIEYARRDNNRGVRGSEVPVVPGAARPLRGRFHYAFYFHGPGGLPARLPLPVGQPLSMHALDYLLDRCTAGSADKLPFVLVAIGPATNVARLLRALRKKNGGATLKRIVMMGGAIDVPGNATPFAEFNTWNDPEAADEVLRSGVPITLVPLDVCNPVRLGLEEFSGAAPTARRLGEAWLRQHPGRELGLADCVAIAALTDPGAFTFERIPLEVDVSNGSERGRTIRKADGTRIEAALGVDPDRVVRLIRERALNPRYNRGSG